MVTHRDVSQLFHFVVVVVVVIEDFIELACTFSVTAAATTTTTAAIEIENIDVYANDFAIWLCIQGCDRKVLNSLGIVAVAAIHAVYLAV